MGTVDSLGYSTFLDWLETDAYHTQSGSDLSNALHSNAIIHTTSTPAFRHHPNSTTDPAVLIALRDPDAAHLPAALLVIHVASTVLVHLSQTNCI